MLKPRRGNKRNLSVFVPVCCLVAKLCLTLCDPMDCSPPGSSAHGISRKNTGVGCHFLLSEIFPTQGLSPCLLCWQAHSSLLSHQGSPLVPICFSVAQLCLTLCDPMDWSMPAFLIQLMTLSRQVYRSGLPFPSPVDHILSELSTMTHPSWVALHGMAHSFIELFMPLHHKTVSR